MIMSVMNVYMFIKGIMILRIFMDYDVCGYADYACDAHAADPETTQQ